MASMSADTILSRAPGEILGASSLSRTETDEIQALIERWTSDLVAGRIAAWESVWADDAVLMPAGHARVVGRAAIRDYVTRNLPATGFRFTDWGFAGRDDLAVVANQVEIQNKAAGPSSMILNQMMVLRRGEDRRWRLQAVIFTPASG
jgi:ketosteroid isomerase-like protein